MDSYRDLIVGLLTAVMFILILWGSITLSITEDQTAIAQEPTITFTPSISPTATLSPTPVPTQIPREPTYTPSVTEAPTSTPSPSNTPSLEPTQTTTCPYPEGWIEITINSGDTLGSLAITYATTEDALREGNCLIVDSLAPGSILYVPGVQMTATATATVIYTPCGPPVGWVNYTVKSGDTLYKIGLAHGVTVIQLQQANCLGSSSYIQAGQNLYVPFVATLTFTYTSTPTSTGTSTATQTSAPATATSTHTASSVPPTSTNTLSPTETDTPNPTSTFTNTATTAPTETQTPSLTPTPISSPTSTVTP